MTTLLEKAVSHVLKTGVPTTAGLQEGLNIGFSKAKELSDRMKALGIIKDTGVRKTEILVNEEQSKIILDGALYKTQKWHGVTIQSELSSDDALVMCLGARAPSPECLKNLAAGRTVWAVDKGADACMKAGIVPEMIIGDKDSASKEAWEWTASHGAREITAPKDKDDTDFQLALKLVQDGRPVLLTGAFGGRFDHLWSLIFSFLGSNCTPLGITDEKEGLCLMRGSSKAVIKFEKKPKVISLIPMLCDCTQVNLSGTKWPLEDVLLKITHPYAISNSIINNDIKVALESGTLAVYWKS